MKYETVLILLDNDTIFPDLTKSTVISLRWIQGPAIDIDVSRWVPSRRRDDEPEEPQVPGGSQGFGSNLPPLTRV